MSKTVKIRRGSDIKLKGSADKVSADVSSRTYVIKPTDFHSVTPKLVVKEGHQVKAGSPLFYDKYSNRVKYASPVSGEVVEINRGEKRKILEIKILADKEISYAAATPKMGSRDEVIETLCENGLWPFIIQRPYDVVANPDDTPKAIHISAFDTHPLAADKDYILHGRGDDFQKGLDVIKMLTPGKVHLNVHRTRTTSDVFLKATGVEKNTFEGPHPSGNVGVQIHHIDPINSGDRVWVLQPEAVAQIGRFYNTGKYDASRIVALAGSQAEKPKYYKTIQGVELAEILKDNLKPGNTRVISGNVLTGDETSQEGFLGFYHSTVTVLPEGDEPQFLGWIAPNTHKFSFSRTYFSWLMPNKEYDLDTNTNGEPRSFVVTGQYEKVFPMDIYPQQLIKAMMVQDIEQMEGLGVFEVAPEDFALAEFGCTSKMPLQKIVRESLDLMLNEVG